MKNSSLQRAISWSNDHRKLLSLVTVPVITAVTVGYWLQSSEGNDSPRHIAVLTAPSATPSFPSPSATPPLPSPAVMTSPSTSTTSSRSVATKPKATAKPSLSHQPLVASTPAKPNVTVSRTQTVIPVTAPTTPRPISKAPPVSTFNKSGCLHAESMTIYALQTTNTAITGGVNNQTDSSYMTDVRNGMNVVDNSLFAVGDDCAPNGTTRMAFQGQRVFPVQNTLSNIASQMNNVCCYEDEISLWKAAVTSNLAPLFAYINSYSGGPSIP
jgi:hypothetical protein